MRAAAAILAALVVSGCAGYQVEPYAEVQTRDEALFGRRLGANHLTDAGIRG